MSNEVGFRHLVPARFYRSVLAFCDNRTGWCLGLFLSFCCESFVFACLSLLVISQTFYTKHYRYE